MPITFLHTADWQLGKPYARVADVTKRSRLQNERFECLHRIGAAARDHQAAFVLVAGDLFDSPSPVNATVARACEAIGQMHVPVLAIPGNHDHGGPGSLWDQPFFLSQRTQLAPNLRVLLTPEPVVLDHAVVFPAPLLRRQEPGDPTAWIRTAFAAPEFPTDLPRIVLAHGSVQGFESAQDDEDEPATGLNRIDLARLPAAELDYLALGDWHGTKQVGPNAWYSGTPEIDRFPKGSDNDPGNLLVVRVARGQAAQVEKKPTGRFIWNDFTHRFSEDTGFAAFCAALDARIGQWGQDSLLKLSLDGSLGIETSQRLAELIEGLDARLLRLKLEDRVMIAPTEEEIQALADRPADPLIAAVAGRLLAMATGAEAGIARHALRELHAAIRQTQPAS
jgi:DNA repair exonuclease SbcCD nuclease subunit